MIAAETAPKSLHLGCPATARCVGSGSNLAYDHNVWVCRNANSISQATTHEGFGSTVLRDQCFDLAQRIDSVCLHLPSLEKLCEVAKALDCSDPSPVENRADRPVPPSSPVRSKTRSNRRNAHEEPKRHPHIGRALPLERRKQEIGRETVSARNRNVVRKVAAANSAHAGNAFFSRRRKSNACSSRIRLQYSKCIHLHVQKGARGHADVLL